MTPKLRARLLELEVAGTGSCLTDLGVWRPPFQDARNEFHFSRCLGVMAATIVLSMIREHVALRSEDSISRFRVICEA